MNLNRLQFERRKPLHMKYYIQTDDQLRHYIRKKYKEKL